MVLGDTEIVDERDAPHDRRNPQSTMHPTRAARSQKPYPLSCASRYPEKPTRP
jgi:hypothetical protein